MNGLSGLTTADFRFGRINLRNNYSANFTFTLVDPNNNDSEVFADFDFSVMDLDTGSAGGEVTPANEIESVQLLGQNGTATWATTTNTELSSAYQATTPRLTGPLQSSPRRNPFLEPPRPDRARTIRRILWL